MRLLWLDYWEKARRGRQGGGGRSAWNLKFVVFFIAADVAIECKALRSKRYITDGFCTSLKPVEDMVCTGNCLPISDLPWYAEFLKVWSRTKTLQYRCVDDIVRYKRVTFVCDSGETRSYKIRVVRSCKCKKYLRNQNESPADHQPERSENRGRRRHLQKLSNLSNDQKWNCNNEDGGDGDDNDDKVATAMLMLLCWIRQSTRYRVCSARFHQVTSYKTEMRITVYIYWVTAPGVILVGSSTVLIAGWKITLADEVIQVFGKCRWSFGCVMDQQVVSDSRWNCHFIFVVSFPHFCCERNVW